MSSLGGSSVCAALGKGPSLCPMDAEPGTHVGSVWVRATEAQPRLLGAQLGSLPSRLLSLCTRTASYKLLGPQERTST